MHLCCPLESSISTIVCGISLSEWISVCGPGQSTEPRCETCQPHHTSYARRKHECSKPNRITYFLCLPDYPKGAIGHIVHTEKGILAVERNKILIPPLWSKTFCWGFEDFSCCFGTYGSEKVNKKNSKNSRNELDVVIIDWFGHPFQRLLGSWFQRMLYRTFTQSTILKNVKLDIQDSVKWF